MCTYRVLTCNYGINTGSYRVLTDNYYLRVSTRKYRSASFWTNCLIDNPNPHVDFMQDTAEEEAVPPALPSDYSISAIDV